MNTFAGIMVDIKSTHVQKTNLGEKRSTQLRCSVPPSCNIILKIE